MNNDLHISGSGDGRDSDRRLGPCLHLASYTRVQVIQDELLVKPISFLIDLNCS